jgi:hypothetical protein
MTRRAARVDSNHSAVVGAFRACGCEVESMAGLGNGAPDLLIYHRSTKRLILVEVKDGKRRPSERKLTAKQVEWHERWPVHVITSVEQVTEALR